MSSSKRRRTVACAALALAGALLVPLGLLAPTAAVADVGACPPGYLPAPGNDHENWTDNNVAVFAGGDFLADGESAESEGLLVVMGDATFDKSSGGTFNVGWVGVGSQAAPAPGSVMLAVGGALNVGTDTTLDVGSGAVSPEGAGGGVQVGETATPTYPSPQYELNNGSLQTGMGAAAVSDWAGFEAQFTADSADWVALADTNAVSISGAQATFNGDGTSNTQVFTITAAQLNSITEVYFTNVADDAPVIINVVGSEAVTFSPTYFADDGVRADDLTSPIFGMVAQRTMWNFADTANVTFGGGSQFLGSVVAPNADIDITASMNGRVYAGGDIHTHGTGNELHNYPWIGPDYGCIVATDAADQGTADLTKVLTTEGVVAPDRAFFGWLRCTGEGVEGDVLYREGFIRAGQTLPGRDLPVGAECELFEDPDRVVEEADQDPLPPGFLWAAPRWMVNGQIVDTPTFIVPGVDDPAVEVTVTNTLLGQFSVEKIVTGPDGGYIGDRAFEIAYSCDAEGFDDEGLPLGAGSDEGTLAVAAGDTALSTWFPVGTTCEISEETLAVEAGDFDPADGYFWQQPVIDPASITVGAGDESPVAVTVTNTFAAVAPETGWFTIEKNVTGADAPRLTFTGTWSCERPAGTVVADGEWSLTAGQRTAPLEAPVDAVCTVDETVPADSEDGTWADPVITGAPLTVTADSADEPARVVVTNAFTAADGTDTGGEEPTTDGEGSPIVDGELSETGSVVPWWAVAAGAVLLAAGLATLVLRPLSRRRS